MSSFDALDTVKPYKIWEGAVARAVKGDRITLAVVDMEPGVGVPIHQHANEQVGFVLRGTMTMTIGDDTRELHAGETYVIPGDTPHGGAAGPEGASVVDVFNPPRADWEEMERLEPSAGAWP